MAIAQNVGGLIQGLEDINAANDSAERLRKIAIGPQFSNQGYQAAQYLGDFNPALLDTPEAAQYQTISEDPRTRNMEMDALQSLINRTSGAADARMNADQFNALDQANQLARGREGAIRQDMARKGQTGAGMDAVLRAQSAQEAANRARSGTMQAVQDAALQKLAANNALLSGASNVRGEDYRTKAANSDIVNRFNMFNTQARNARNAQNVGIKNDAGMRNIGAHQAAENARATVGNQSLDRNDRNVAAQHDAQMQRFEAENALGNQYRQGIGKAIAGGSGAAQDLMSSAFAGMSGGGSTSGASGAMKQGAGQLMAGEPYKYDEEYA